MELPDGSSFCNKCGASLGVPAAALSAPSPAAPASSAANDPELELWKGRFSGRAHGHRWVLWVVWVSALVIAFLKFPPSGQYATWVRYAFLGAAFLPLVAIVWSTLILKLSIRYRLTTHRLFREMGILSRHINEVELVRVDDVAVRQNLIQRIFNVGVITVISPTDQTEPTLELVGIENPIEVKEQIRAHVRRRRQGSLHVENL
ncbi:MAG TPA: PH domain-containing protein [Planctomycetota bacterium]|nr:PH domain-containing protein [Planctomycetota bacterium]